VAPLSKSASKSFTESTEIALISTRRQWAGGEGVELGTVSLNEQYGD